MIVLYGINKVTETLLKTINEEVILASTHGKEVFPGYSVLNLQALSEIDEGRIDKIIICSMYVEEISNSLLLKGFSNEKICFFNCVSCLIEPLAPRQPPLNSNKIFYTTFDLAKSLPSFDAVNFFCSIESQRKKRGAKHIHLLILPPISDSRHFQTNIHHDADDTVWRTHQIILHLARCLPSITGVSVLTYREQLLHYPLNSSNSDCSTYDLENPKNMVTFNDIREDIASGLTSKIFQAPTQATAIAKQFIATFSQEKPLVVINLREYTQQPFRNSDLMSLGMFVTWLEERGYYPALMRDTYNLYGELPESLRNVTCIPAASLDLTVRIAFYQQAFLTMSVNTGPSNAFYFVKDCNSIEFRWNDEQFFSISKSTMEATGFPYKQQPYFKSTDYNKVFWGKDSYINLKAAFQKFESWHTHM
ncbi:hypothetical protein BGP78_15480 [Pseudoalteromonas sp. MSK9-3]|uniref:hypothetical protein n=1 Tax=Pseudoalteromonas sp. MSK9-3 TaxID=1897633 RepID=UPI000E6C38BE|nr:hypothetical protein [Pseudoalteromonas sp. MSK9-3]RJE75752.1 hypothetical protein BGP78_15480 [Pseudoalteromonas sp. MSK9-3]